MSRGSGILKNNRLKFLLIGSGMGAGLALLFAPTRGLRLRTELMELARSKFDRGGEAQRKEVAPSETDDRMRSDELKSSNRNSSRSLEGGVVDLDNDDLLELT
jgi:gas vesicle protein